MALNYQIVHPEENWQTFIHCPSQLVTCKADYRYSYIVLCILSWILTGVDGEGGDAMAGGRGHVQTHSQTSRLPYWTFRQFKRIANNKLNVTSHELTTHHVTGSVRQPWGLWVGLNVLSLPCCRIVIALIDASQNPALVYEVD